MSHALAELAVSVVVCGLALWWAVAVVYYNFLREDDATRRFRENAFLWDEERRLEMERKAALSPVERAVERVCAEAAYLEARRRWESEHPWQAQAEKALYGDQPPPAGSSANTANSGV